MLGTGSAFAKTYFNTNALIYSGNHTLLLDCGITAPLSLYRLGKPMRDIDALLVSHIHADHIGGMEEFAFQMKFVFERKPLLFIPEPLAAPLWESSLKGGLLQDECASLEDYFEVRLLQPNVKTTLVPGLIVEPIQTAHIPNKISYSYLFNDTFFYSADLIFNPDLLRELVEERGVETIFHDCQLKPPGVVHTTLAELQSLPLSVQERIWLMHYDDTKPQYEGQTGVMRFVEQHERYRF
ncbi:MBL fold metallo-hydrolase [Paenibacillus sacheonensis]|uniref:MBL fold metallo-hydrolase n=2 Tax=Paenibacillus sacheonensis TaxID=742054 RepID=A0A7X4YXJ7_9BACL|nr:MBL fold metallo-hydrolase [Paenibacillus sacheonensis]NBC73446.1 MBL fold metallo-hydrolase [Paenibacillus sacheonensis]